MRVKTKAKLGEKKVEKSDFARWISNYRELNGLSQRALADKMGISNSEVALTEIDRYDFPLGFYKKLYVLLTEGEKESVRNMFKVAIVRELEGRSK